ncbi:MAG TPA: hypothetical protein VF749_12720 [Candidatus Acidoferrum sp.]
MGVPTLGHTAPMLSHRAKLVSLDQNDLAKVIGQNAGRRQARYASTHHDCAVPACLLNIGDYFVRHACAVSFFF